MPFLNLESDVLITVEVLSLSSLSSLTISEHGEWTLFFNVLRTREERIGYSCQEMVLFSMLGQQRYYPFGCCHWLQYYTFLFSIISCSSMILFYDESHE